MGAAGSAPYLRRFNTRAFKAETSALALVRLCLTPLTLPLLALFACPLLSVYLVVTTLRRWVVDDPVSPGGPGGMIPRVSSRGEQEGLGDGAQQMTPLPIPTPFLPQTPFTSPLISAFDLGGGAGRGGGAGAGKQQAPAAQQQLQQRQQEGLQQRIRSFDAPSSPLQGPVEEEGEEEEEEEGSDEGSSEGAVAEPAAAAAASNKEGAAAAADGWSFSMGGSGSSFSSTSAPPQEEEGEEEENAAAAAAVAAAAATAATADESASPSPSASTTPSGLSDPVSSSTPSSSSSSSSASPLPPAALAMAMGGNAASGQATAERGAALPGGGMGRQQKEKEGRMKPDEGQQQQS